MFKPCLWNVMQKGFGESTLFFQSERGNTKRFLNVFYPRKAIQNWVWPFTSWTKHDLHMFSVRLEGVWFLCLLECVSICHERADSLCTQTNYQHCLWNVFWRLNQQFHFIFSTRVNLYWTPSEDLNMDLNLCVWFLKCRLCHPLYQWIWLKFT